MAASPLEPLFATDTAPVSARALPDGTVVGRFEIVHVIADTSLGLEYLAVDRARGTEFVLKEYLPQRLARRAGLAVRPLSQPDADALARGLQAFVDEARSLMRIDHPALVRVTDLIEANATAYQVITHRGGSSLLHLQPALSTPPDEASVRALLDGLLGALDALHRHGLLHRAVAPGHILLLADDRPLLLGPDPARIEVASGLVESLMAAVEPSFAAPEQLAPSTSQPLGAWTDLYSLAETLRFWISGELPPPAAAPPGRGRRETMEQLAQRLQPAVEYSDTLLRTLDAALAPNAAGRPQSVTEFRAALGAMPSTPPLPDRPAAPPSQQPPSFEPRPPLRAVPDSAARVDPAFGTVAAHRLPRAAAPAPRTPEPPPPRVVLKRPRTRQRAFWASLVLVLLLGGAAFQWWRLNELAQGDAQVRREPTPVAAAPVEPPAPAPAAQTPASEPAPSLSPTPITEPTPAPAPAATQAPAAAQAPAPAPAPATTAAAPPVIDPAAEPPTSAGPAPAPAPAASSAPPAAVMAATPPPPATPAATTRPPATAAVRTKSAPVPAGPASPREACAGRTQFSLYRCMQSQCEQRGWAKHPQCERLRATDSVD